MSDSRREQRRRSSRRGGRRQSDPILDLATHPSPRVYVPQLAEYWGVDRSNVFRWCQCGRLTALFDPATRTWSVGKADALAFELDLFRKRKAPPLSPIAKARLLLMAAEAEVARLRAFLRNPRRAS